VDLATWFEELKRRRVFRAVATFGVVTFAVLQVVEPIMHALHLPDWVLSAVVLALAACFPVVVVLAWLFDLRGGRLHRAEPLAGGAAPSRLRLGLLLVGLGLMAAAPGVVYFSFAEGSPWRRGRATPSEATAPASSLAATVAVLPFVDMSPQRDQEYFSDGIAEEILGALAHVEGLRVIGRTSSFAFKGKGDDLASIARKLGAGSLLEGSVRREGDRVRVTAQLINAADGLQVWSERFDRQLTGVFAVQEEIAGKVAAAIRGRLAPSGASAPAPPAAAVARPTTSPEAYAKYLLGRHFIAQVSKEGFGRAIAALEQCLALDPDYAPAWASLAYAEYWYVQYETSATEQASYQARGRRSAERAVQLAPTLPEAYAVRGFVRLGASWDRAGAEADMERARALGLGDANMLRLFARFVVAGQGRLAEAIAILRQAVELDPLASPAWVGLGNLLDYQGRYVEGQAAIRRSLEIAPGNTIAQCLLSESLARQGRGEEALAAAGVINEPGWRLYAEATALWALGRRTEADRALAELERKEGDTMAFQIAVVRARRGEADPTLDWLERALRQEDGGLNDILIEPGFKPLREHPRYRALLAKMHLPPDATVR
jgi:serine/threonine-protein kinase